MCDPVLTGREKPALHLEVTERQGPNFCLHRLVIVEKLVFGSVLAAFEKVRILEAMGQHVPDIYEGFQDE